MIDTVQLFCMRRDNGVVLWTHAVHFITLFGFRGVVCNVFTLNYDLKRLGFLENCDPYLIVLLNLCCRLNLTRTILSL